MCLTEFTENHEIDTRAVAAFRIGLGLLLIADILLRSRNFWRLYTDRGVVSADSVTERFWETGNGYLPIWGYLPDPEAVAFAFCLAFIAGLLLVIGYKSRYVAAIAFILVVAIDGRNPLVLSYADTFFRLMLFWSIFLPLGARWSVDAVRDNSPRVSVASIWTFAALFQICWMYLRNAQQKFRPQYWVDSDLVPVLMTYDHVTYSHTELIAGLPIWPAVTWIWAVMMLVSPIMFFLRGWLRAIAAFSFISVHLTMAATLRIGAFPYAVAVALLLFFPPVVWNNLEQLLFSRKTSSVRETLRSFAGRINAASQRFEPSTQTIQQTRQIALGLVVLITAIAVVGLIIFTGAYIADPEETGAGPAEGPVDAILTVPSVAGVEQPPWAFYHVDPPYPSPYYVIAAETESGQELDIYNERELSFDRPHDEQNIHFQYDWTYRERFLMSSIDRTGVFRSGLLDYYCTKYNSNPSTPTIESLSFYTITENVTASTRFDRNGRDREMTHHVDFHCQGDEPDQVGTPPEELTG